MRLYNHAILNGKLSADEIKIHLKQKLRISILTSPIKCKKIKIGKKPPKIFKMAKKAHVDSFFERGCIRLGGFNYFNNYEHPEIGDVSEGKYHLVGLGKDKTFLGTYGSGFNHYIFCTYSGEIDKVTLKNFGYDSGFEIVNLDGFLQAVSEAIEAKSYTYAECVYSDHKVFETKVNKNFDFYRIDRKIEELIDNGKYFVKPIEYSSQREFRMVFEVNDEVKLPLDVLCPDAIQYCRRIKV
jgi:hypothetical protein